MNTTTNQISQITETPNRKLEQNPMHGRNRAGAKTLVAAAAALTLGLGSSVASASHGNYNSGHSGSRLNLSISNHRHGRRHNRNRGDRGNRGSHRNARQAYARVINVQPVYRRVRVQKPHRECWTEYQQHNTHYEGQRYNSSNSYDRGSRSSRGSASPLLGTIVGGVIGSQVGRYTNGSSGSIGGAIAGALIGTAIASESGSRSGSVRESRNARQYLTQNGHTRERFDRGSRRQSRNQQAPQRLHSTPVERCETRTITTTEQQISSYDVTYRYHGKVYHTSTRKHPGDRIAVDVSVRPRN